MRKWLTRLGASLILMIIIGVGYQQWGEWQDARAFPMPGQLVDVGGHRLHIWCVGDGAPTILMLSGSGTPSVNSYELQTKMAKTSRVCSYDRTGLGWSDPPTRPMGLGQVLVDLDTLLANSGERGPYVLVPESFGGIIALTMAARMPAQVAGIVAVDCSEPAHWLQISENLQTSAVRRDYLWQFGWRTGIIRGLFDSQAPPWVAAMSPPIRGQFKAVWNRPNASFASDWIDIYRQTPRDQFPTASPGLLGDKPLIVISHGQKSDFLGWNRCVGFGVGRGHGVR